MRKTHVVAITIIAVVAALLAWISVAISLYNRAEYDSNTTSIKMKEYFAAHEAGFEKIRYMFETDRFPGQIWQNTIGEKVDQRISSKRVSEYQKIMKTLKIFRIDGNESYFEVTMISEGDITTGGRLKGYVYFASLQAALSFSPLNQAKTTLDKLNSRWNLYASSSGD